MPNKVKFKVFMLIGELDSVSVHLFTCAGVCESLGGEKINRFIRKVWISKIISCVYCVWPRAGWTGFPRSHRTTRSPRIPRTWGADRSQRREGGLGVRLNEVPQLANGSGFYWHTWGNSRKSWEEKPHSGSGLEDRIWFHFLFRWGQFLGRLHVGLICS